MEKVLPTVNGMLPPQDNSRRALRSDLFLSTVELCPSGAARRVSPVPVVRTDAVFCTPLAAIRLSLSRWSSLSSTADIRLSREKIAATARNMLMARSAQGLDPKDSLILCSPSDLTSRLFRFVTTGRASRLERNRVITLLYRFQPSDLAV